MNDGGEVLRGGISQQALVCVGGIALVERSIPVTDGPGKICHLVPLSPSVCIILPHHRSSYWDVDIPDGLTEIRCRPHLPERCSYKVDYLSLGIHPGC